MSTLKTNVLFLDHTAKLGGGELALLSLTARLNITKYHPVVVLASEGPLVASLRAAGVDTYVLPLNAQVVDVRKDSLGLRSLVKLSHIYGVAAYSVRLSTFVKTNNIGIIHTNSLKSDVYGAIVGLMTRVPVVWHIRDHITPEYLPRLVVRAFQALAKVLPTAIVANSHSTLDALDVQGKKPAVVAYSGVEDEALARPLVKRFDVSEPVITLVGRITRWKGQHIFIEAAAEVVKSCPGARFQIVGAPLFGEEDYQKSLHELTASHNLQSNVSFLGFRSDISEILENSDIVVHTSCIGEPFGQVVVQGMAAGKPVVATRGGALPEIVQHAETGLLTTMGDAEELARAIVSLLKAPEAATAMGLLARDRVRDRFTISRTVDAVIGLYSRIAHSADLQGCSVDVLTKSEVSAGKLKGN